MIEVLDKEQSETIEKCDGCLTLHDPDEKFYRLAVPLVMSSHSKADNKIKSRRHVLVRMSFCGPCAESLTAVKICALVTDVRGRVLTFDDPPPGLYDNSIL